MFRQIRDVQGRESEHLGTTSRILHHYPVHSPEDLDPGGEIGRICKKNLGVFDLIHDILLENNIISMCLIHTTLTHHHEHLQVQLLG